MQGDVAMDRASAGFTDPSDEHKPLSRADSARLEDMGTEISERSLGNKPASPMSPSPSLKERASVQCYGSQRVTTSASRYSVGSEMDAQSIAIAEHVAHLNKRSIRHWTRLTVATMIVLTLSIASMLFVVLLGNEISKDTRPSSTGELKSLSNGSRL